MSAAMFHHSKPENGIGWGFGFRGMVGAATAILLTTSQGLGGDDLFDMNEDEMFGEKASLVDTTRIIKTEPDKKEEKGVATFFSGTIKASGKGTANRAFFDGPPQINNTTLAGSVFGSFDLDVRAPHGVKALVTAEIGYLAPYDSIDFGLREMFLDCNIRQTVFFRMGKQVLQWGRGFFFNPVDLVNIERKQFFNEMVGREGVLGIKAHVPFLTKANLYGFLDMDRVTQLESMALSLKAEFLMGPVEFALTGWGSGNAAPVVGFDFSTGLGGFQIIGEYALHRSVEVPIVVWEDGMPRVVSEKRHWVSRTSCGIGRYFDLAEVNDRILVQVEGYFNQSGSSSSDLSAFLPGEKMPGVPDAVDILAELPKNLPGQNEISKCYVAVFATINRFFLTDMTLSVSTLANVNQKCLMLAGVLRYETLHNLAFDLLLSGFYGDNLTEYTVSGQAATAEFRITVEF
jgi:hypothetical protein